MKYVDPLCKISASCEDCCKANQPCTSNTLGCPTQKDVESIIFELESEEEYF